MFSCFSVYKFLNELLLKWYSCNSSMGDRLEEGYYQVIFGPRALEMDVKLIIEWLTIPAHCPGCL